METVCKTNQDPMSDQFIEYSRLGLQWQNDLSLTIHINKKLFKEHIIDKLDKINSNIQRKYPKIGDLVYFDNDPLNQVDGKYSLHYEWIFEINDVIFEDPNDITHYYKDTNYTVILKPYKNNMVNEIDKNILEDVDDVNINIDIMENNKRENNIKQSENKNIKDRAKKYIIDKRKDIEL